MHSYKLIIMRTTNLFLKTKNIAIHNYPTNYEFIIIIKKKTRTPTPNPPNMIRYRQQFININTNIEIKHN